MTTEKLDNPAWHSLCETHNKFAIDYNGIKFYDPEYCPFGGFVELDSCKSGIDSYSSLVNDFYVVGERPIFSEQIELKKELVCAQMVLETRAEIEITEEIITIKTPQQRSALFELVNLVQPGYFKSTTSELGSYFGIHKNDKLVAVTGERMKMDSFTEISAVVTHPDHIGKGYAKQLVAFTSNRILEEWKTPYLHVTETNNGAIALYEKLGFKFRRKMSFWNFNII